MERTRSNGTYACLMGWAQNAQRYGALIKDGAHDSEFLRSTGLRAQLLRLVRGSRCAAVLDAGCGDGWLLDALKPQEGHGCDVFHFQSFPGGYHFRLNDVRSLSYTDDYFDLAIASLVLIWFPELDVALRELHRVTKPGGRVVIAIMNPYFYRTGEVDNAGNFVVTRDLSKPFVIEDHRIAQAVGPFQYHYRPLTTYLNECVRAGLRIEQVEDSYIDMDDFIRHFGTDQPGKIRRTGKVPMYTFIKCGKP